MNVLALRCYNLKKIISFDMGTCLLHPYSLCSQGDTICLSKKWPSFGNSPIILYLINKNCYCNTMWYFKLIDVKWSIRDLRVIVDIRVLIVQWQLLNYIWKLDNFEHCTFYLSLNGQHLRLVFLRLYKVIWQKFHFSCQWNVDIFWAVGNL